MSQPRLAREEAEAIAVLARHNRLLVIVIPRGVSVDSIKDLKRDVDARLEELVKERGPLA